MLSKDNFLCIPWNILNSSRSVSQLQYYRGSAHHDPKAEIMTARHLCYFQVCSFLLQLNHILQVFNVDYQVGFKSCLRELNYILRQLQLKHCNHNLSQRKIITYPTLHRQNVKVILLCLGIMQSSYQAEVQLIREVQRYFDFNLVVFNIKVNYIYYWSIVFYFRSQYVISFISIFI